MMKKWAGRILGATSLLTLAGCLSVMPMMAPKAKIVEENISAEFPYTYEYVEVMGSQMAYVEAGDPQGTPIVLVHGNPTSAYLWRNVIPHLEGSGRVIAVDLIGMGKSGKPNIDYRFNDHTAYFTAFMDALDLEDVVLVIHDWGGGIGFDYAARHEDNVKGIAFFEAVARPELWSAVDAPTRYMFGKLRDEKEGHKIIAENNYFLEKMLPMLSGRKLTEQEMAVYNAPYPTVESRKPVAQWPREIPVGDWPEDNISRIGGNYEWMKSSDVPMKFIYAEPGLIWNKKTLPSLLEDIPRMDVTSIGSGVHYLQETQPKRLGTLIAEWIDALPDEETAMGQ